MSDWVNLSTVSAAVTLVLFAAEIFKIFQGHEELRRHFLVASAGFFLGSVLTASSGFQISLGEYSSPLVFLMATCCISAAIFVISGLFNTETGRKSEFYILAGLSIAGFFVLMVINAMWQSSRTSTYLETDITFEEKIVLAKRSEADHNLQRAIDLYDSAERDLSSTDPRAKIIDNRINALKQVQVAQSTQLLN